MMGADVKGDIYEGLLEKNAEDTKSGAGQYFTPRALIRAMVECVRPEPGKTIADPACGTGGFFLAAYDFLTNRTTIELDKAQKAVPQTQDLSRQRDRRQHAPPVPDEHVPAQHRRDRRRRADFAQRRAGRAERPELTTTCSPIRPSARKARMSFTNEEGEEETDDLTYNRQDFWATTSNKQLNFVQHIRTMLKTTGRAAVVVPDNVLFEGGAGETVRAESSQDHRAAHHPAPADRHFLRPGREGERDLLRQPRGQQEPVDEGGLVLRLPHQHPPHPEKEAAALRGSGRVHRVLQPQEPPQAQGDVGCGQEPRRPLAQVHLRRTDRRATRRASISSGSRTRA